MPGGISLTELILDLVSELETDVWWEVTSVDPGLTVELTPAVHYDVPGNTTVRFTETISVDEGIPACTDLYATVTFFANEYDKEGDEVGTQQIHIHVKATPVPVDIKPQSCPNPLNVKSKGVLPVAILGTADFDVTQVIPETARLKIIAGPGGVVPLRWAWEDVATPYVPFTGKQSCLDCTEEGPDGYMDLTLKFDMQEVVAELGDVNDGDCLLLRVSAQLSDGSTVGGQDMVVIIKKGKK